VHGGARRVASTRCAFSPVLAGYDKGVRPTARHQSKQLQLARRRLAEHRRRHRSWQAVTRWWFVR